MKIKALKGQNIKELSMIEVAHAILDQREKELSFAELFKEVQNYLEKSDEEMNTVIARFYTELNTDGSFIPVSDHKWALRSWYAIDSVDEETISLDYFDDAVDDAIDSSLISSEEDPSFTSKVVEEIVYDENADDEQDDTVAYDEELAEVDVEADIPEEEVVDISEEEDVDRDEDSDE